MQPPWHCLPALPSIEGTALCHSPWHRERKTELIEEEGMSLSAPLTPQNEIDRLAEVIAPSTIFFGRKYCYRQIGDSISGRRWGSRLWSKGCVCPLLLRLQCLLMLLMISMPCPFSPILLLSFYIQPLLFLSPSYYLCFVDFLQPATWPCTTHTTSLSLSSLQLPLLPYSSVSFWPFSSLDHLWEPKGGNSISQ